MRQAWRIVKGSRLADALSGEGARLAGGRWNHPGTPVVYASETLSLAALELFIHFSRKDMAISRTLVAIPILIPDSLVAFEVSANELKDGWRSSPPPDSTRDLGSQWARNGASPLLSVPSAIIPEERNLVMNPRHEDFSKISLGEPHPFTLDNRIWK